MALADTFIRGIYATLTLRAKYMALACTLALGSALFIAGVNYHLIVDLTLERAYERQAVEARLIAPQIHAAYQKMRNDALAISQMPPFQGLVRSTKGGGFDPKDGSSSDQWRWRLQTIFASVMAEGPEYAQMRFVGIADNGREIVRTERHGDSIAHVPSYLLQAKAEETYIRNSLALPPNEVHFSTVSSNRDYGEVYHDQPMLRVVAPVHDTMGNLFGFMVINAHYGLLLTQALTSIDTNSQFHVVNDTGDYILRSRDGSVSDVVRGKEVSHRRSPAVIEAALRLPRGYGTVASVVDGQQTIISVADVAFDGNSPNRFTRVVVSAPQDEVLASAYATRRQALLLTIVLLVAAGAIAFGASGILLAPLRLLVERIRGFDPQRGRLVLPIERQDEVGDLARAFGGLVDNLKQAGREQEHMLLRLEAIADNTVDGLITIAADGTVLSYNKGASQIFGFTPDEVIGANVRMLMPQKPASRHDTYLQHYQETGERRIIGHVREVVALTKDGTELPVELSISEVNFDRERVFSGIVRDISDRKALEREIQRNADALVRSNNALNEFAYIASHDLKEPLRAIHNHVQFLEEDHGADLGESGRKRIGRLKQLCERSDRLISELLQFSRLAQGDMETDEIDMNEIVHDVQENLADSLEERNAKIEVATPLPKTQGDPSRIQSLMHNLVVNGIKYNDSPERRIEVGYTHHCPCEDRPRKAYYVRDNGIGIAPEFKDSVFRIFKRLNNDKAYGPGTGAGLSFAKKIVERHGGDLWFESAPGAGTTFYFNLPESTQ